MSLWDQLAEGDNGVYNKKPIWTMKLDDTSNEEHILKWLNQEMAYLKQEDQPRLNEIYRHYKLYKGVSSDRVHQRDADREDDYHRTRVQNKVVINHLYDLTEQMVSQTTRFKPAVAVMPTNDEFEDKQASKLAKRLFDHVKYMENLDRKQRETVRVSKVAGEGYLFVEWDKDAGDVHPLYKKLMETTGGKEKKIALKDENGNVEKDENGNVIYVNQKVHVGEVVYNLTRPEKMFFENRRDFEDADYFFRINERPVEEIRADFPKKADKVKANYDESVEYANTYDMRKSERKVDAMIIEFWHRPTKYLEKGIFIKFTPDTILEVKDYPYDHGQWPFYRLTDIEIPSERHARSFFINGRQVASQINNLTTMAVRNIKLASSPKWMMPRGACKIESLGNATSIVQYKGPTAPQLITSNTTSAEVYKFRDQLKDDLQLVSGISGVSRGEPPAGVTAAVALQFLNEQENERNSSFIAKYNEMTRHIADLSLKVCAQFYDRTDGRTIAVLGKNDEYTRVPFDPETLAKEFDIRIQNSSALPESKSGRIQSILDLSEKFPQLVTPEQVADMLDFGQVEKWYDEGTAAVRSAERENEQLLEGESVEPQDYEMHIQHWRVHVTELQKPGFRELPEEIQNNMKDHIMATEMMMQEQAIKNPMWAEKLMTLGQFPLLYMPDQLAPNTPNEPILDPEMEPGAAEDANDQQDLLNAERAIEGEAQRMAEEQVAAEDEVMNQGAPATELPI